MKERLLTILAALALPVTLLRSRPANGPFPTRRYCRSSPTPTATAAISAVTDIATPMG